MTTVVENLHIHVDSSVRAKNVFKKELMSILKPFHLLQTLYILSMYRIRDGFITPNSVFYNVVSGIWSLLLLVGYFLFIFKNVFTTALKGFNFVKCLANIPTFLLYSFGNVTNYWTNVTQRHNTARLMISFQKICEMLKADGRSLKSFMILNWIYVIALILFRVYWVMNYAIAFSLVFKFNETIVHMFYFIFDVNMLYCVRLMRLLSEPLRIWIDEARNSKFVEDAEIELYWDRKFSVYMEIFETYQIVEKTFEKLILYYCADTFINGVISIWLRIEIAKVVGGNIIKLSSSLVSLLWLIKNMILVIALCFECESFYFIMTEVHSTCIQLSTSSRCPESQKRVCKNIQRDQTASFKKMTAWGLFVIDGELPLLLCGLLTTYIIVVLQFEFL